MIFRIYFFAHFINIFSEAISRFPGFRLSPHSFRTLRALPIGAKQRSTLSKAPALHRCVEASSVEASRSHIRINSTRKLILSKNTADYPKYSASFTRAYTIAKALKIIVTTIV